MIWREFKALGTDIVITVRLGAEQQNILVEAEKAVIDFETKFSRFIIGNELFKLNNSSHEKQVVSKTMAELLKEARHYYLETKNIFDPTIIGSLEAVGYDKKFDLINSGSDRKKPDLKKIKEIFLSRPKMDDLKIEGRTIRRPLGFKLDFGGIGKGYIIDFLSKKILSPFKDYWISAGGDLIVSGYQDNNSGWDIGVQDPLRSERDIFYINNKGRKLGVATSGTIKRTGKVGNFSWHHIIDPRSGLPVINDVLSVTVISSSAVRADVFAKTVLILGEKEGLDFIENKNDSACLIFIKHKKPIFSKRANIFLKKI
ncbi:MAG: FAD:protein FMN transferase [Patescibacteria group bacterium]